MKKNPQSSFVLVVLTFSFIFFVVCDSTRIFAQANQHSLQVASFLTSADAQNEVNRLKSKKLDSYWVKAEIPGMGTRYRVKIGHFANEDAATMGAAQACGVRAISQYLVTVGDRVPAGVPAKSCTTALSFAAREKGIQKNSDQIAVEKPVQAPKVALPANARPVIKLEPMQKPQVAKEIVKPQAAPHPVLTSIGAVQAVNKPKVGNPKIPALGKSLLPATKVENKGATTNAALTKIPAPAAPVFVPSARPGDTVNSAYQYAVTKAGGTRGIINKNSGPELKAAPLNSEVAIANPKWKLSNPTSTSDKNLRAVYFVDAWTGWAAGDGGTVYQTVDGGKEWSQIKSAAVAGKVVDVNKIYFVNENKGWMLAESRDKKNEEAQTVLLSTDDGGQIWQHISVPNIRSFHFIDAKNGWAVGKNTTMLKTTDGGLRWRQVENLQRLVGLPVESAASNFGFSDVYFLNKEMGWAVGNFYSQVTTNIGGLFLTSDGGDTWQRIPMSIQRKTNSTRFTQGKLHSVRFTNVSDGVITGEMEDGSDHFFFTLKTHDGGETWEQARVPTNAAHRTQFVDATRGWSATSTPQKDSSATKVYDTILTRTDNGGKSWETDFVAHGKQIRSMFFISPTRGWAVGDRGMILRYDAQ